MGRLTKLIYPEITLTLDFGGSGTKGIVQVKGGVPRALYMEPEVIEATRLSLIDKTENNLSNAYPENIAWVGVGDEYRAVGYLAANYYSAARGLRPRKYELALYKTLAAIWVVKQKYKLPEAFRVSLALLLPPGEFEDSSLLKPMLKEALAGFDTPTGEIQANLTNYECFPEGGGIYAMYCKNSKAAIKRQVVALVMVGYRNASLLVSRRGILDKGKTTNLGMARMVEVVMERTAGLTSSQLVPAILAAGNHPKPQHFLKLVSGSERSIRDTEIEKIISAVESARTEYATALASWLKEVLPPSSELDEAIVCGGTADYLHEELDAIFPGTPVAWHGGVEIPTSLNEQWLGTRLADVWALSVYHAAKVKALAKLQEQEKEAVVNG